MVSYKPSSLDIILAEMKTISGITKQKRDTFHFLYSSLQSCLFLSIPRWCFVGKRDSVLPLWWWCSCWLLRGGCYAQFCRTDILLFTTNRKISINMKGLKQTQINKMHSKKNLGKTKDKWFFLAYWIWSKKTLWISTLWGLSTGTFT